MIRFLVMICCLYSTILYSDEVFTSKYIGEEVREIKSLSEDDVNSLLQGKGWGFAKAAELNGVPGPLHLLQMKNEIALKQSQIKNIKSVFNRMNLSAKEVGKQFVLSEKELNLAFFKRKISKEHLQKMLEKNGRLRTELRFIHLSAHLDMLDYLSEKQINQYNKLRGYFTKNSKMHGHKHQHIHN